VTLLRDREVPARILQAWRDGRLVGALRWRWLVLEAEGWRRLGLAPRYRRLALRGVSVIGVTGSCGKTTTKELIAAVLATRMSGRRTRANAKASPYLERAIVRTRPWDDFCLVEMTISSGGELVFDDTLRQIRPDIGVVTVIGTDHLSIFGSAEAVAAQKGRLIECLPAHGTAVLNADDPLVRDMGRRTRARVLTYGEAEDATLRAGDVSARWPERLSFTVHHRGQALRVRTQLCGAHLLSNVLAALAVGLAMDIPLAEAAAAVEKVAPLDGRLSPVDHPDGFTIVRDGFKASLWSIPAALRFVGEARASRKIVVFGTVSDYAGNSNKAYAGVARQAREVADRVIFVGNNSSRALKARRHEEDEGVQAFYSVEVAAEHLRSELRPGDLVLLKGSLADRLDVIAAEVMRPRHAGGRPPDPGGAGSGDRFQVVLGLGNPGGFDDTPHNVGHRVVDLLARALGASWTQQKDAVVARVDGEGQTTYLIKPAARMNVIGPAVRRIGGRMGFSASDCILVHDDLDLPIGTVRVRTRSSDGGHRGVRSVFQAFRTDEIRRVRVGVGRPEQGQPVEEFVLTPFAPATLADVDGAVAEAADRALELLGRPERVGRGAAQRGVA
jgi:aminoacyl-tRNA hydrolase